MICVLTNEGGGGDEEKDQDLDEETIKKKGIIDFSSVD